MTKQDYKDTVLWIAVLTVLLLLGSYLGVNKYKRSCERIMNADQTQTWLECKI